jgi:hypothetical protein
MVRMSAALLVVLGSWSEILSAQEFEAAGLRVIQEGPVLLEPPRLERPEYGTVAFGVRTAHGLGFQVSDSSTTFSYDATNTYRFRTGGFSAFDFALTDLPAGALITGLELEACDSNASAQVSASLIRRASPGGTQTLGTVMTGDPQTPGCGFFGSQSNLPGTHAVDNFINSYFIRVLLDAIDSTTSLGAVRVYYRLQVSPAPAVATFPNDVPTSHPFFRFVEALARAGITGGCTSGSYCPDDPVTRGQMAVFLSAALGLHFPY